jgi:hypothetical protein
MTGAVLLAPRAVWDIVDAERRGSGGAGARSATGTEQRSCSALPCNRRLGTFHCFAKVSPEGYKRVSVVSDVGYRDIEILTDQRLEHTGNRISER